MYISFYIDETEEPHIYKHSITEAEIVAFFLEIDYLKRVRKDHSIEAIGKIPNGRFLKVIYRVEQNENIFVITAFDIEEKVILRRLEDFYESY